MIPAVRLESAIPLRNSDYYTYLTGRIRAAKRRVFASVFIINVHRAQDPDLRVRHLLRTLRIAAAQAIDVRVVVGDSSGTMGIRETNEVARRLMVLWNIRCRKHLLTGDHSMHEKVVIVDDVVMVGSHNWTHRAFGESEEESLAVESPHLVLRMEQLFLDQWRAAERRRADG